MFRNPTWLPGVVRRFGTVSSRKNATPLSKRYRAALRMETCELWQATNSLLLGQMLGLGIELPLADFVAAPAALDSLEAAPAARSSDDPSLGYEPVDLGAWAVV